MGTASGRLVTGLFALLAAGCAQNGDGKRVGNSASGANAGQEEALHSQLVYLRTGGFMGTSERVVIQPDGRLEAAGKFLGQHAGKLSAAQVAELNGLLKDWPNMQVSGQTPQGAADYFVLSITYAGKTLSWTSVTPDVPEGLTRLAQTIEETAKSVE